MTHGCQETLANHHDVELVPRRVALEGRFRLIEVLVNPLGDFRRLGASDPDTVHERGGRLLDAKASRHLQILVNPR